MSKREMSVFILIWCSVFISVYSNLSTVSPSIVYSIKLSWSWSEVSS